MTERRPPRLRPYQAVGVEAIRGAYRAKTRRVLYVLPTGGGKTIVFTYIGTAAVQRRKRILILVHRQELVEQTARALQEMGVPHGVISAGRVIDAESLAQPVQIASVLTAVRRLDQLGRFDLIVIDEAHHAVAGSWRQILDAFPDAFVLGVTATPERLDGRGLREQFDVMIVGPGAAGLIAGKYLCPATTFAGRAPDLSGVGERGDDYDADQATAVMRTQEIVGDAVATYGRLCPGQPALAYCCSLGQSRQVAADFAAAGWRARHIDGETPDGERRAAIAMLVQGELDVITNCSLFTEGVDLPRLAAVILLRPTHSQALYLQMVGRALRPAPGKTRALILDHAGNVWRHGLCDEQRTWSLDSKRGTAAPPPLKECPQCHAVVPIGAERCGNCGFNFARGERRPRELRYVDGELSEITPEDLRNTPYRELLAWCGNDPQRLRQAQRACNYQDGWVRRQLQKAGGQ